MTNGFALSLKIYFYCVKCQAKNDFLKDVESTVSAILEMNGRKNSLVEYTHCRQWP